MSYTTAPAAISREMCVLRLNVPIARLRSEERSEQSVTLKPTIARVLVQNTSRKQSLIDRKHERPWLAVHTRKRRSINRCAGPRQDEVHCINDSARLSHHASL